MGVLRSHRSARSSQRFVLSLRPTWPLVFVPQTRPPGAEAEVDWGQFQAVIGGQTVMLHLFSMWLAFSTRAFHWAYANEAQEPFTDAPTIRT